MLTGRVRVESNLWIPLNECKEASLTVINFVAATQDTVSSNNSDSMLLYYYYYFPDVRLYVDKVVVDGPPKDGPFVVDYLCSSVSPKSVMCAPIVHLNTLLGKIASPCAFIFLGQMHSS